ncbi:MAG: hypothetical protein ACO4AU_15040 [bacterium]|jgi:hypothetical protein
MGSAKLLDLEDKFYRPLWVRLLITFSCLGWAAIEFLSGAPFWALMFGGTGGYCAYQFFVVLPKRNRPER